MARIVRSALGVAVVLAVLLPALSPASSPASDRDADGPRPTRVPRDQRPNIVLISADDMRRDELRYLPKTRALLGQEGMRFTDALTPHPLCCPARAELFTGQYAQINGVRTNFPPQGGYTAFDPE